MSDTATVTPPRARAWLARRPGGDAALRKAVRATAAACTGFFLCRYGLGDTVMATYAMFTTVALGALSDVFGPPATRTRVYLSAFPVAALLVALGTELAAHVWAAVAGMLVVGFAVAFAGVGGPRLAGLANGMQLFYILPCFPPYLPDTLPARLAGLAIGTALVTLADRVLLPPPAPDRFADRVADAADVVASYLAAIREHPGVPQDRLRALTRQSLHRLTLTTVPVTERPTGPGRRDRGLTHAAAAVRIIGARAAVLDETPRDAPPDAEPVALTCELLDEVRILLEQSSAALRSAGPAPRVGWAGAAPISTAPEAGSAGAARVSTVPVVVPPRTGALARTVERYLSRRADWIRRRGPELRTPPAGLRVGVAALALAESTFTLVTAVHAATGVPPEHPRQPHTASDAHTGVPPEHPRPRAATPDRPITWYAHAGTPALWWERVRGNLTPRSVYLQNAVRLALGLAVARAAVDVLHLSYGLWVLLATLTLMRTTLVASGTGLLPAFGGTLAGAVLGAGLLTVVGGHAGVYALLLPPVMLVAQAAGPLLGPLYGQAGFTLVISVVFAQLAPADWHLAGNRVLDVVAGGLIGTAIGAAVWPRGGAGEIRRIAERALRTAAADLVACVDVLGGVGRCPPGSPRTTRLALLFENTYSQYRTEPGRRDDADWMTVLSVVHRLAGDAAVLLRRHPETEPLPWAGVGTRVDDAARDVARGYEHVADAIAARRRPLPEAAALITRLRADPPSACFSCDPYAALRALDAWGWLHALAHDLGRAETALDADRTPAHPT